MTIEEAIKHAEEVMVENLGKTKGRNASDTIAINCSECAEEHRQLAEWLKELKDYKDKEVEELEKIKAEINNKSFAYSLTDNFENDIIICVIKVSDMEKIIDKHIKELNNEEV